MKVTLRRASPARDEAALEPIIAALASMPEPEIDPAFAVALEARLLAERLEGEAGGHLRLVAAATEARLSVRRTRAYRALVGMGAAAACVVLLLVFNPLVGDVINPRPDRPSGPTEAQGPRIVRPADRGREPSSVIAPGRSEQPRADVRTGGKRTPRPAVEPPIVEEPTEPSAPDQGADCGIGLAKPRCSSEQIGIIEFASPKEPSNQTL